MAPLPVLLPPRSIEGNQLKGKVPDSWAALKALKQIDVQPGNPDLCTAAPPGASFQMCVANSRLCKAPLVPSNNSACSASQPPPPPTGESSGGSSSDSGVPVAAIAVPVAVVGAAALAGLVYLAYRKRWGWVWPSAKPRSDKQPSGGGSSDDALAEVGWVCGLGEKPL